MNLTKNTFYILLLLLSNLGILCADGIGLAEGAVFYSDTINGAPDNDSFMELLTFDNGTYAEGGHLTTDGDEFYVNRDIRGFFRMGANGGDNTISIDPTSRTVLLSSPINILQYSFSTLNDSVDVGFYDYNKALVATGVLYFDNITIFNEMASMRMQARSLENITLAPGYDPTAQGNMNSDAIALFTSLGSVNSITMSMLGTGDFDFEAIVNDQSAPDGRSMVPEYGQDESANGFPFISYALNFSAEDTQTTAINIIPEPSPIAFLALALTLFLYRGGKKKAR